MINGAVEFPPEIVDAQNKGNLVIFAGAGVSIPEPSGLPSFDCLADLIGAECRPRRKGENPQLNEPPDEYLGSLHQGGKSVKVHEKAAEILLRKDSSPTSLHAALLRIFFPKSPVRLVTTNFDRHFSTAAQTLGISDLSTYMAPALPLGNDFEGLVYLHGASWKQPGKIVLTDRDFGRAYLTEAWASRFLYQMFLHYTVLFVGYSHNDVVMKYIAKGLPTNLGHRRFILTEKNDREWAPFAIQPLYYDLREEPNSHLALTESIEEWAVGTHRGLHEKAEIIRSMFESVPPLSKSKEDHYLRDAVRDPETAKFFRKHSKRSEYLQWARSHHVLEPLFSAEALDEAAAQIAEWYICQCIPSHHDEALRVYQQLGPALNPAVCRNIAHALRYSRDPGYKPVFSRWVAILLNQEPQILRFEQWERLLHSCSWPGERDISLLLLERCFSPILVLRESFDFFAPLDSREEKTYLEYEVNIAKEQVHWLRSAWDRLFKPNLSQLNHQLHAIITTSFEKASGLLRIGNRNEPFHDPLGFRRLNIRFRGSLYGDHVLDVMISAALDLMNFNIENHGPATDGMLQAWENSRSPILTRIATLGISQHQTRTADEKLQWLAEKKISFLILAQAEVRELLKNAYPPATPGAQQSLLDYLFREFSAVENESHEQFEIFKLIESIVEFDPHGTAAKEVFTEMQKMHTHLKPRRSGSEESFHLRSRAMGEGIDFDKILSKSPAHWIGPLIGQKRPERSDFDLDEKIHALMGAVSRNPDWGFEAQKFLVEQNVQEPAFWNQLFNGWREAKLDSTKWCLLIDSFSKLPDWQPCAEGIAEILSEGTRRTENAMPKELFNKAFSLSQRIFVTLEKKAPFIKDAPEDWLGLAINRAGGNIAQFWLQYLANLKESQPENWKGIPDGLKTLFETVLASSSDDAKLARVVLASQLHLFFFLDADFATESLLPLFDWQKDPEQANQSWQGFLIWGNWKTSFLDLLLPFYHQTLDRIDELNEMAQESFVQHIAGIAVYGVEQPWVAAWLPQYISAFQVSQRQKFAQTLRHILEAMSPEASSQLWDRWLKIYWNDRISRAPAPLDEEEVSDMAAWPLSLKDHFPEAVELLDQSPPPQWLGIDIEKDISRDFIIAQTDATGKYLNLILPTLRRDDYQIKEAQEIFAELLATGLSENIAKNIRNSLTDLE